MSEMTTRTLRTIFEEEFEYVCRVHRRLGVPERDLEDAAQETFLALHAKLDTYDPRRPIRPWIFGFALRVAANHRRKPRPEPLDDPDRLALHSETPEQQAATREATTLAMRALEQMKADRREIFVMHDLEGFGAPQIAEMLSIELNTVYSRLRTAREEFERAAASVTLERRGA